MRQSGDVSFWDYIIWSANKELYVMWGLKGRSLAWKLACYLTGINILLPNECPKVLCLPFLVTLLMISLNNYSENNNSLLVQFKLYSIFLSSHWRRVWEVDLRYSLHFLVIFEHFFHRHDFHDYFTVLFKARCTSDEKLKICGKTAYQLPWNTGTNHAKPPFHYLKNTF